MYLIRHFDQKPKIFNNLETYIKHEKGKHTN